MKFEIFKSDEDNQFTLEEREIMEKLFFNLKVIQQN